MKLQKPYQTRVIGSVAALALLLAMGTANAGKPDPDGAPNNKRGPSIGVSNTCELASDEYTGKPVLRVTTTIINKSSEVVDEDVDFTPDGTRVRAKEKGSGKGEKYQQVGETAEFTGKLGETVKNIQLCAADDTYLGPDNTVSLNASITINVDNDNKSEYASRCSDDPETEFINEGKVVVSAVKLDLLCSE